MLTFYPKFCIIMCLVIMHVNASDVVKINVKVNKNGYLYRRCSMLQVPIYVRKFTLLHVLVLVEQDKPKGRFFFFLFLSKSQKVVL